MQISCRVHTEVPEEGVVSSNSAGIGGGVPGFGGTVGMQSGRGAPDARSRAYVVVGAAEIFGVERDGIHQGQERDPYRAGICGATEELRRSAFLGAGFLGVDGGQERGCRTSVYPEPGKGRQTPRTTGDDGALSASQS